MHPLCTLLRDRAVRPNNVPEKKEKMGVLGMGRGHLASASELNLKQFWARGGASRGRVFAYTPI